MNPTAETPRASKSAEDLRACLNQWFEAGHSRLPLILSGKLAGSVLVAHDKRPAPPQLIVRQVISLETGLIVERIEREATLAEFAADPDNGPALAEAVRSRLAGRVAPPPICPKLPQNIRKP